MAKRPNLKRVAKRRRVQTEIGGPTPRPTPSPQTVTVHNSGAFVAWFSIQWNGGESGESNSMAVFQSATLDVPAEAIEQSCWLRAYFHGARGNHDSGDNFTGYSTGQVKYELSGSLFEVSWERTQ